MQRTQRPQPTAQHPNGLTFRVIAADSYTARMSRDRRQLVMTDGQLWNVGAPVGWYGVAAAWRTEQAADRG